MRRIQSLSELPAFCDSLSRDKFFGEVRLIFRNGRFERVVVEQSFQVQPQEMTPNVAQSNK